MFKMLWFFYFFLLSLAILHVTGQESVELLTLHDHSTPDAQQTLPLTAAIVPNERLKEISSSIVTAEIWTKTHVLSHYPGTNITTIVVGHNLLCEEDQEGNLRLILPSLKNIHYTLTRWGLHKEIKVSTSFSSSCIHPNSGTFRADIAEAYVKPLLTFLNETYSPYLVISPLLLPTTLSEALKNLGFFNLNKVHMVFEKTKDEPKPTSRKLSFFLYTKTEEPFPPRPTPLAPTNTPAMPPLMNHAYPPYPLHLPPCNPSHGRSGRHGGAVPPPVASPKRGLWCVAKPSVPAETLQGALDYACGGGGADCAAIRPRGSCYYPNTVVAHASYAFNSYWQKTKKNGGTCGFGGTAMLIDSDPSYGHCRFNLA